jgi:predicted AAA+ superfamily ATPase
MLQDLFIESIEFFNHYNSEYKRYFIKTNKLTHKLSIILGDRGIGKTTTLAQIMTNYPKDKVLYINLDDIEHIDLSLVEVAKEFELYGGKLLLLDEIHKYKNWSSHLKTIYDKLNIQVIASGSSALEINKGSHDLSRRSVVYHMFGMSFREFLELHYGYSFDSIELENILENHLDIALSIKKEIEIKDNKILALFKEYLEIGYYPYFLNIKDKTLFFQTLRQNINTTIESDLLSVFPKLNGLSIMKLKLLFNAISKSVPMSINLTELKKIIDVKDDRTLKDYISKLELANLIKIAFFSPQNISNITKNNKIYLANTNLMYLTKTNIGNIRETFFLNQISNYQINKNFESSIYLSNIGDFVVDEKYIFEIGGKKKSFKQIKDIKNSFVVADDIEVGFGHKIPLWLFGFLY